jgi:predicted esterase
MLESTGLGGPHHAAPVYTAGEPLESAAAVLILLHGRGATAPGILELAREVYYPEFAYLAPQAAGNTWYPHSFLVPLASNEPWLSSALEAVEQVVGQAEEAGIPAERIVLGGFSQGACLASEYVARHARRYGGLLAFSGGLIGPPGTPRRYAGSLAGTPVFLGCSDVDPHIPRERVDETATTFERMGGQVVKRLYPGMGHTVNSDELKQARAILRGLDTTLQK